MMTTTLHCKILPGNGIPENSEATFDTTGRLLVAMTLPGHTLPDSFEVEAEDGVVFTVARDSEGHVIDEDDRDIFIAMIFG